MYDSSSGKDPGAARGCAGIRLFIRFSAAAIRPWAYGCRRGVCVGACPEKVQAIKAQINELCGISTKATRKKSRMTSSQWVSAGRAITGGRRECVA